MNRRDFIYAASVGAVSAGMPAATIAQNDRAIGNDTRQ